MTAPSPPSPGPDAPPATRLAALYTALALAADEPAILAAVAAACAPYGLAELRLLHIVGDERGRPREGELAARWPDGGPPHPRRVPVGELPLAPLWLRGPGEPLAIADLDADLRADPAARARLEGLRAVTVVPLRDERLGVWQGVLYLGWSAPHAPAADEPFFLAALLRAVTAALATRRTLQAHADALAETQHLYAASAELNQADSLPALLAVLGRTAAPHGATRAWLLTVDDEPDARAERGPHAAATLTLEATWPADDPAFTPGQRHPASAHPLLELWQRDGLVPIYFADVADDRRLDAASRGLAAALGVRGCVALPLAWRGRFVAVAVLGWPGPHAVRPGEQRLYTAVARQAAVVLDNRNLLEQARRALDEHSRRRATLATLLDNLPVGVFVSDARTGETQLLNRVGAGLLRDLADPPLYPTDGAAPLDRAEWTMTTAARTARTVTAEFDLMHGDGRRTSVDAISAPMFDERGAVARVVSVFQDVGERRRAEAERVRLQTDLVRLQAAALAERQAPLIPVGDDILVLPIVGAVDPERGQQILETLVGLGGRARARVAILDLTGARDLDLAAADAILGAARALRLRGVQAILAGCRPDAAAALTAHGVDLGAVPVAATLQAAIARAEALVRRPAAEARR